MVLLSADVQREPGHLYFNLSRPPIVQIGIFVRAAGKVGRRPVHEEIELCDFTPFEVTPQPGRRQSASGLGQSRVRQRSPWLQVAIVLA